MKTGIAFTIGLIIGGAIIYLLPTQLKKTPQVKSAEDAAVTIDTSGIGNALEKAYMYKSIDTLVANAGIKKYRATALGLKTQGLSHDTAMLKTYVDKIITFIRQKHATNEDTLVLKNEKYTWRFGFYFTTFNNNGSDKTGFYMAPILVSTDGKKVIDYFKEHPKLNKQNKANKTQQVLNEDVYSGLELYDEGTLWP
ncbi:MAG: hypothetical protein QM541_05210 [Flavobacterium sp.]|nr:hypothetical protein [Flavobacterium sp.]